jgi:serine/threonine protein kinase
MGFRNYTISLCYRRIPFSRFPTYSLIRSGKNKRELFEKIMKEKVKIPETVQISKECNALIKAILNKNPEERIKIYQIYSHPWVEKQM